MKLTVESCKYCKQEERHGLYLNAGHLIADVHFDEQEARHLLELLQVQIVEWDKEGEKDNAD